MKSDSCTMIPHRHTSQYEEPKPIQTRKAKPPLRRKSAACAIVRTVKVFSTKLLSLHVFDAPRAVKKIYTHKLHWAAMKFGSSRDLADTLLLRFSGVPRMTRVEVAITRVLGMGQAA